MEAVRRTIRRLTASRPAAVVLLGTGGPATSAALTALSARETRMPVVGGDASFEAPPPPGLADLRAVTPVLPSRAQSAAGRRVLADISRGSGARSRPEALYGYAAMRLVLAAIDRAGPNRRQVVQAALSAGTRNTVLGRLSLDGDGDVRTRRLGVLRVRGGRSVLERVLP